MKLDDFKYAGPYVKKLRQKTGELRRLAGNAQKYRDMATNISKILYPNMTGFNNYSREGKVAGNVTRMVDANERYTNAWSSFIKSCFKLSQISDVEGANIIFYYHVLQYTMSEVVEEVNLSRTSCWRHMDKALEQLDLILQKETDEHKRRSKALTEDIINETEEKTKAKIYINLRHNKYSKEEAKKLALLDEETAKRVEADYLNENASM